MIVVTPTVRIEDAELRESFVRASGPGGQNVNKVSTAVELRFDAAANPTIGPAMFARLRVLAGRRMTGDGVIVIDADRFRAREMNRADALERLLGLLREAAVPPRPRSPTRPTLGSKLRRLEGKAVRARVKRDRGAPGRGDD